LFLDSSNIACIINKTRDKVILFNIADTISQSRMITFEYQAKDFSGNYFKAHRNYLLIMEKKIFSASLNDTLFKIRFKDFGLKHPLDDLVWIIGKKHGLLSFYSGNFLENGFEVKRYIVGDSLAIELF
jgi:hypothetical protein